VGVPGAVIRVAMFDTGDGSLNLELLEHLDPPSPIDEPMSPNALGAAHLAFRVDDIEAKVAELSEKGVKFNGAIQVIDEGPLTGMHWVYFRDPAGSTLELIETDGRLA
jgi:catechol 2,3-dioxygenase-like lactoylglutathione lyase family enzyme